MHPFPTLSDYKNMKVDINAHMMLIMMLTDWAKYHWWHASQGSALACRAPGHAAGQQQ